MPVEVCGKWSVNKCPKHTTYATSYTHWYLVTMPSNCGHHARTRMYLVLFETIVNFTERHL